MVQEVGHSHLSIHPLSSTRLFLLHVDFVHNHDHVRVHGRAPNCLWNDHFVHHDSYPEHLVCQFALEQVVPFDWRTSRLPRRHSSSPFPVSPSLAASLTFRASGAYPLGQVHRIHNVEVDPAAAQEPTHREVGPQTGYICQPLIVYRGHRQHDDIVAQMDHREHWLFQRLMARMACRRLFPVDSPVFI